MQVNILCEYDSFFFNTGPPNQNTNAQQKMFRTFSQTAEGGPHPTLEINFKIDQYEKW